MTLKIGHLIDGGESGSASGASFTCENPATGEALAEVALGELEDVDRAVESAALAFADRRWAGLDPSTRASRLRDLASLLRAESERLGGLESDDTGKPLAVARGEVGLAASLLDYASTLPENVRGAVHAERDGYFAYSIREPYGVVAAIAPWNFPLLNAVWKVAPALAVGNSVVLKMAEQTPLTTAELGRLALEAGIPAGVLNVVHGDGPTTGAALVAHPKVRKITFTGSTEVGRSILRSAADQIKSCHLELGGKTPNIVFADADLDQALDGTMFTSFFNSGQICTSGSRLLLDESIADEFLDALEQRMRNLAVGDPREEATQLGPLISGDQRARVEGYIEGALDAGAAVRVGGGRPPLKAPLSHGYFVEPTLLVSVNQEMTVAREEIFGPVLSVLRFRSEEEAVQIANDVAYGLAATVWTTALDRAMRMSQRLEAGIIWTNCPHHLTWQTPYEGHRDSGLGEDLGLEAVNTFTTLKVNYVHFGSDRFGWA